MQEAATSQSHFLPVSAVVADKDGLVIGVHLATPSQCRGNPFRALVGFSRERNDYCPPPLDEEVPEHDSQVLKGPLDDQPCPVEDAKQYRPQAAVTLLVRG